MKKITGILSVAVFLGFLSGACDLLPANPTGGQVVAGKAGISSNGNTLTIQQSGAAAIINWQSFSIRSGETTQFLQPSATSAALNRVTGGSTSYLNGTLSANGQIYLINSNGIVIGKNGMINTQSFIASTRDISDTDFLSGNLHFTGSGNGEVQNLGTINALGGNVYLLGKTVDNEGTINAAQGTVGLAAADDILLNPDGQEHVFVQATTTATAAPGKTGVLNGGTIAAASAELKAANGNIYALAVNNEGVIRASTVTRQGGHIWLTADSGAIVNSGTLDASATAAGGNGGSVVVKSAQGTATQSGKILARGGQGGSGGNAEVSGQNVQISGSVDLSAPGGSLGTFLIDPTTFTVASSGGDETGAEVGDDLQNANVTLQASSGIVIDDAISWTSGSSTAGTLTLQTTSTGSTIAINQAITGPNGGLVIDAAGSTDLVTTSAAGAIDVGFFVLQSGQWVQNLSTLPANSTMPAFTASSNFEIQNGTFLRIYGGTGTPDNPYSIGDIYGLQGMESFLGSSVQLNQGIDASSTATWNPTTTDGNTTYAGFVPIGTPTNPYTGQFSGNSITNLTINLPNIDGVGLFGAVGSAGQVANTFLTDSSITGRDEVGGIAGVNSGTLTGVYVNGGSISGVINVGNPDDDSGGGGTGSTGSYVGGIAGINTSSGTISNSNNYNTLVTGNTEVGGIAGENDNAISSVTSSGPILGVYQVGGLVGLNVASTGTISSSSADGSVTGMTPNGDTDPDADTAIGGLVGENDGMLNSSNTFTEATVTGGTNVGGLVGYNSITGTIENSYNSANSTTSGDYAVTGTTDVGGIAGENDGYIVESYNAGSVTGTSDVGGIAGLNYYLSPYAGEEEDEESGIHADDEAPTPPISTGTVGTIDTCYNIGAVNGSAYVGGLAGENSGFVRTSYDSGPVTGSDPTTTAALVGYDDPAAYDYNNGTYDGSSVQNSYWDVTTSGQANPTNNDGYGDYTESNLVALNDPSGMPDLSPYALSSYGNFGASSLPDGSDGVYAIGTDPIDSSLPAYYIIDGQTRPLLGMEYAYNIFNAHQMQLVALNPSYAFSINTAPDQQEFSFAGTSSEYDIWNPATGFVPIGSAAVPFSGEFYGNGAALESIFIDRPTTDDVGLFGYLLGPSTPNTGSIYNVNVSGASITGQDSVGGAVGYNAGGLVQNGYVSGTITGADGVGGVVGTNAAGGTVTQFENDADIAGSTAIGGIVGINYGTVDQSVNQGTVGTGVETLVGGVVGDNFGTTSNSYSTTTVSGASTVGGLVGQNEDGGILESSYATSDVDGANPVGSVVGVNLNGGIVRNVYWETGNDDDATGGIGQNNDTGGNVTDVVGYNQEQLTDARNFAQGDSPEFWDFAPETDGSNGPWGINVYNPYGQVNNGLPVLQWQTGIDAEYVADNQTIQYGTTSATLPQGQYTVTGNGASDPNLFASGGPTLSLAGTNTNAGTTDTIIISGLPSVNDYNNVEYVDATATIIPRTITVSLLPPISKVYDGNTSATLTADNYQVNNTVNGDTVLLNDPTDGAYDTKDVGTDKAVTVNGVEIIGGSDPENYTLDGVSTFTSDVGTITPAPLSVGLQGTITKVYDGTTAATIPQGDYTLGGLVSGDSVTVNAASANYANPNVGNPGVLASGFTLGGPDGEDYMVTNMSATGSGAITPAPLIITANGVTIIHGQNVPPFTSSYSGLVDSQTPSDLNGTLVYTLDPAFTGGVGSYAITPSGQTSSNYAITYRNGTLLVLNVMQGENQRAATVESELTTIIDQFADDPFNGIDPLAFLTLPSPISLAGEETGIGAINDAYTGLYLAYGSSTWDLPAQSRLITPNLGIITLANGLVTIGCPETQSVISLKGAPGCLPAGVFQDLKLILSPRVYNELQPLIYGRH